MPLYEYRCSKCDNVFEVIQKFSDAPLTVHEACGGSVERLISRSGFSLKGSGWYATDYPRAGSKKDSDGDKTKSDSKPSDSKPADSNTAESKSSETKSETKTETKPAGSSAKND